MDKKNTDHLNILYVVNACLPNKRAHGIQIVNTCNAMCEAGASVQLTTPAFFGSEGTVESYYGVDQKFTHKKLFSFDIAKSSQRFRIRSLFFFFSINLYLLGSLLKSIVTREKFVVYARGEVAIALIPISYLIPVLFETHQIRNHEWLYKLVLKRVAGIVVITDALKQKFIKSFRIKESIILVARDSVDLEKFSQAKVNTDLWTDLGIIKDKKIVLYTGSLSEEKGVYTLADSASLLPEDCHVVFLGGLPAQIQSFKSRYGDIENINIAGQVGHILIPAYIKSADVLVLPDMITDTYSRLYTSPMKLFEYMASGTPIVASDVPSVREVLTEKSAKFFDSVDPQSLADSIKHVLSNPAESKVQGEKAQEIVSEFTWKKRGERIVEHIQNCI